MNEELKKQLLEIVDQIADLDKKMHEIARKKRKIWDRTSVIRAQLVIDIAKAKDEKDKPMYSNSKLREAALTLRLKDDEGYQGLLERLRELDEEQEPLVIEHNRLVDQKTILMMEMGFQSPPSSDNERII